MSDLIVALVIGVPILYVVLFWEPCICSYSYVRDCPRHGRVRDEDGNPLVGWLK